MTFLPDAPPLPTTSSSSSSLKPVSGNSSSSLQSQLNKKIENGLNSTEGKKLTKPQNQPTGFDSVLKELSSKLNKK